LGEGGIKYARLVWTFAVPMAAAVIFLEEIFPRKGQDICFLGKVTKFGMKN
jgi:hypothetical protein